MKKIIDSSISKITILKINEQDVRKSPDAVAVEAPLEIKISIPSSLIIEKNISITMRTPGQDLELALGFLVTEGIIESQDQYIKSTIEADSITIELQGSSSLDLTKLDRHFYTTSSCGVCGKSSIEAIKTTRKINPNVKEFQVEKSTLLSLNKKIKSHQVLFDITGGIHAASIFDINGKFVSLQEDVGRHNALDKLIGHFYLQSKLPLNKHILFLSGRASFELIQKAVMSGISLVVAVGAPSSLAISLAKEYNITLIGFLSSDRFNIYNGEERVAL